MACVLCHNDGTREEDDGVVWPALLLTGKGRLLPGVGGIPVHIVDPGSILFEHPNRPIFRQRGIYEDGEKAKPWRDLNDCKFERFSSILPRPSWVSSTAEKRGIVS